MNKSNEDHPIAYTILATGGSGKERNLIYQPKPGVSGKKVDGKKTVLNSEGIRVMTPNEWGRLQGFIGYGFIDENGVDSFSFPQDTTDGQKYKQFGNSVSIPVIRSMAEFMLECFELLEEQQSDIIHAMAENNVFFTKRDVMEVLDLNPTQAGALLKTFVESGELLRVSRGKTTRYTKNRKDVSLPPYSQEEKVIELAEKKGTIRNADVQNLLNITPDSTNVLLSVLTKKGVLMRISRGKYCINCR